MNRQALEHDGQTRNYDLYVPDVGGDDLRPLVLDLHGFTSSAAQQRLWSGMLTQGSEAQLFVAWPTGLNAEWNGRVGQDGTDDVGFLRALVTDLVMRYPVDPSRVYAMGFSQGGLMVNRLACDAADLFAGFVSMAGTLEPGSEPLCEPARPVPILQWRGENDDTVPYEGGPISVPGAEMNAMSAAEVFDFWRDENQCSGVTRERLGSDSFCDVAHGCGEGTVTRACTLQGSSPVAPHIIYQNTLGLDLGRASWTFLSAFTHPDVVIDSFTINPGLNDAWYNPATSGQGFFVNVFAETGVVFLAWFTFDVEPPSENAPAVLGEAGHRWLTAVGAFDKGSAVLDVTNTSGGVFDRGEPAPTNDNDYGTIILRFQDCATGLVEYDLPAAGVSGMVAIRRVVGDNVALCEMLSMAGTDEAH